MYTRNAHTRTNIGKSKIYILDESGEISLLITKVYYDIQRQCTRKSSIHQCV